MRHPGVAAVDGEVELPQLAQAGYTEQCRAVEPHRVDTHDELAQGGREVELVYWIPDLVVVVEVAVQVLQVGQRGAQHLSAAVVSRRSRLPRCRSTDRRWPTAAASMASMSKPTAVCDALLAVEVFESGESTRSGAVRWAGAMVAAAPAHSLLKCAGTLRSRKGATPGSPRPGTGEAGRATEAEAEDMEEAERGEEWEHK